MHPEGRDCLPPHSSCNSSCVKIYLCSNPEDSVIERRALRESVLPKFREHCRCLLGLEVRVIDPFESSNPSCWPDENTRHQLIEECRKSSAGPFLLALVGHEYGAASLPSQVEVTEFQLLLQESQQAGVSTHKLEKVYQRDENIIPPSYCLRPSHTHRCTPPQEGKQEINMKDEEEELRQAFHTAASLCVQSGLMTPDRAKTFYRSALDADLRFALDSCPLQEIGSRCVVYVHQVLNANKTKEKKRVGFHLQHEPEAGTIDHSSVRNAPTRSDLLSELCYRFLPGLVTSCQLLLYTTMTECDRRHGYTTSRRRGYADSLCRQALSDLEMLISSWNIWEPRGDSLICDALSREWAEQKWLCGTFAQFYEIIQPEEQKIRAYVEQREQQCPLVVTGGPCTGKTVLVAHCIQQMKSWVTGSNPVVINYFCNLSIHTSPKHLLFSLCSQIACRYDKQNPSFFIGSSPDNPSCISNHSEQKPSCSPRSDLDSNQEGSTRELSTTPYTDLSQPISDLGLSELKEHLASLLALLPSSNQPLVLILDGLDQLENDCSEQISGSLPSPLPPYVKLIFTISSNRKHLLRAIKLHYPPGRVASRGGGSEQDSGYVCAQLGSAERKQCVKMLTSLLRGSRRRVTSGQQALLNQALASCCLPLYARLLHAHTSLWHSDSDVTERSLPDGVHSSISTLLDHLEHKHGSSIVTRAVSYLTLSRTGLSEAELAHLLSGDDDGLAEDRETPASRRKATQVEVETLLLDLKSFLVKRTVADTQVLSWVSRHFELVAAKRYLSAHAVKRKVHSVMADYFSGQWPGGHGKRPLVNRSSRPKADADSHPYSQPFVFSPSKDIGRVNMRKVLELPHHLQQSGRLEEFECRLLMSLVFHQAMVQAGLLDDLVAMLETDKCPFEFQFFKERLLLAGTLRSSACFLQSSPLQLRTVMETKLSPYLKAFPALEGYVKHIREERRKSGRGLGVALCPGPHSVPAIQYLKYEPKTSEVSVTETTATGSGVLAEIMDDGSAWFWKGSGCQIAKLSLSRVQKELKFAGVKSSGHFLLLSTQCNKLFVWDVTGPEIFLHVKDPLKTELESCPTPNRVQGFVASHKTLGIWWQNETFVSVFDIPNETMTHFECKSSVTCLVFSSNDIYVYCGQEDGVVSMFDIKTSSLLGTFSNSSHSAVMLIILCEDKHETACVDGTGNVAVWVLSDKQPHRLLKENLDQGQTKNVLNTDYSDETSTLLVCQSHKVTLWDTSCWELWDQFLAPQRRAFKQALLAQEGHLFLALLDTCTLVLVWRVSTGECVLSLETKKEPHSLLKTLSDIVCATSDGCLTVWDSDMIHAAGSAPKMRREVREVVVDPTGEWFYSTDRSEEVWRWSSGAGLPDAYFMHDGPVDKLQLSPNGVHLVSLSAGDIYVWLTETGENVVRISGSRATDVLITPNSNFGVSISKHGLSRVWKMAHGVVVCSIHLYLSDAQVTPESTFLIGLRGGDLLAASLWSGSISKRFSCIENLERVVAFRALSEHPDFVLVMVASGAMYTWKVAEETVCWHFQLPNMFHCQPQDFQMTSCGSYALLSTENNSINLLDLYRVRLCSFKADGLIVKACLDKAGCYVAHISRPTNQDVLCACSLHTGATLTVTRLSDGERIGSVPLFKHPSALVMREQRRVFVGFEDGSLGVYSVTDAMIQGEELVRAKENLKGHKQCPFERKPLIWVPQAKPNISWV